MSYDRNHVFTPPARTGLGKTQLNTVRAWFEKAALYLGIQQSGLQHNIMTVKNKLHDVDPKSSDNNI